MSISIQEVWNNANAKKREIVKRDYLYASEVGRSMLDVYYAVNGEKPTNPFDQRVQRIFDAGSAFEWLIKRIMQTAGLLLDEEVVCETPETEDCLSVHGRVDMLVGGNPDPEKIRESDEFKNMPEFLQNKVDAILDYLSKNYKGEIIPFLTEVKSVNSNAFWAHKNIDENTGYFKGYDHHKLGQATSYMIARGEKSSRLFYVSRDDLCLMECEVFKKDWEEKWYDYVRTITKHIREGIPPEREPDIVFNPEKTSKFYPKGKYEVNWNLARSPYLTKITGLSKEKWETMASDLCKSKNNKIKDTKANREKQNDTKMDSKADN